MPHLFLLGTLSSEALLLKLELLHLVFERVIDLAADFRHFAGLTAGGHSRCFVLLCRCSFWKTHNDP